MKHGILVFTDQKTLDHKKSDGFRPGYCFWTTAKYPKKFKFNDNFPIYFAVKGIVQGYFITNMIVLSEEDENKFEIEFYSNSWVPIKNGEHIRPSQGWRYYPIK